MPAALTAETVKAKRTVAGPVKCMVSVFYRIRRDCRWFDIGIQGKGKVLFIFAGSRLRKDSFWKLVLLGTNKSGHEADFPFLDDDQIRFG